MDYLIDTHVCLWAIADKEKLSAKVRSILEDMRTKILVSQVSLLEVAIKIKVGKLNEFEVSMPEFVDAILATGFELLLLKNEHFFTYSNFDFPEQHRDPFDRMLISIAQFENATLISKDEHFRLYSDKVKIVW